MGSLVLGDVSESLWSAYQAGRGAAAVPAPLTDRWDRCRRLGAPLEGVPADLDLLRGEALRARSEPIAVLRSLGAASLGAAARELSARDHVLLLADPGGVIVGVEGGGGFADEARRVLLIEGACWSEAARGTNAIGTAAAEARPVTVIGRAHFARNYHGLVCAAAPVRDPDGTVRAVLDATSIARRADPAVGEIVVAAAHALERLLRLEAYAGAGADVVRVLAGALEHLAGPALLVEAPGHVVRMNHAARALLGADPGARAVPGLSTLDLSWPALVAEATAPTPGGRRTALARTAVRLRAEPIVTPRGVLAVLVYLEPERRRPAAAPSPPDAFADIFAHDPALRAQLHWARQLAASDVAVMLLAETGAGKERVARAIHAASPRAAGPFVAVNCGALAPSLLESELFGYAPAAFTGADRRGRTGLLHAASGGTLLLDEVADMPPAMQAALLRVLEDGTYQRVGESTQRRADVRLVCATCRDLPALVDAGAFRKDLYYRLRGAVVRLPPLRARTDLVALAEHLLDHLSKRTGRPAPRLAGSAAALLRAHPWPGNVRELRSCLEVALVIARDAPVVGREHLPPELADPPPPSPVARTPPPPLAELESRAIDAAMRTFAGNVSAAAKSLGVARSTLYRRMRRDSR